MAIPIKKESLVLVLWTVLSLFLIGGSSAWGQNAGDYFPSKIGNSWRYRHFVLDTLQNRLAGSESIVVDSLTGTEQISDTLAFILVTSSNSKAESTLVNVVGPTIFEYAVGYPRITSLLPVDSLGLGFVWDYLHWYPYLRFNSTSGVNDTLLYFRNNNVFFKGQYLSLIIRVIARRFPDTSITVPAGTYLTTPFGIALNVSIPKSQPPLGRYEVPLFNLFDTLFVAKSTWLVREIQSSTYYPLNNDPSYNVATTHLPGFERVLEKASITSVEQHASIASEFSLGQNYPNPFNPGTVIKYQLAVNSFATVRVYDELGREVARLVNGDQAAGSHSVRWDAANFSSGVYFYALSAGSYYEIKKMVLMK
jgi:hypothetical protein